MMMDIKHGLGSPLPTLSPPLPERTRFAVLLIAQYEPGFSRKDALELLLLSAEATDRDRQKTDPSYGVMTQARTKARIARLRTAWEQEPFYHTSEVL